MKNEEVYLNKRAIEAVVVVLVVVLIVILFSPAALREGPGRFTLFGLFLLSPLVFVAGRFLQLAQGLFRHVALAVLGGIALGLESSLALVSVFALWLWYGTPGDGRLEPLFVTFGLVTATMEAARRDVYRILEQDEEEFFSTDAHADSDSED